MAKHPENRGYSANQARPPHLTRWEGAYAAVLDASPLGIAIYNADGDCVGLNDSCRKIFGMIEPFEKYCPHYNLFLSPMLPEDCGRSLRAGISVRGEGFVEPGEKFPRRGKIRLYAIIEPIRPDESSDFDGYAAVMREMAEGENSEAARIETEKWLEALLKAIKYRAKVLLVEDNPMCRLLIEKLAEFDKFDLTVTTEGIKAIELAASEIYDLIFLDIQLPDCDGTVVVRAIRERERSLGRRVPIVAMTAYALKGDRENFLAMGMDDYISKPFDIVEVSKIIFTYSRMNRKSFSV